MVLYTEWPNSRYTVTYIYIYIHKYTVTYLKQLINFNVFQTLIVTYF